MQLDTRESDDLAWHALQELLRLSNDAFVPLADPLAIDFGAHRWLSSGREEAYSDWLEWVLKQSGNARQILRLLGVQDEDLVRECTSEKPDIKREYPIKDGVLVVNGILSPIRQAMIVSIAFPDRPKVRRMILVQAPDHLPNRH